MNISVHKLLILPFVFCWLNQSESASASPTAWDYSPVGECISKYKAPKPTAEYSVNVQVVKNADAKGNTYLWVWDPTPAKNPTRQLIRVTPKKIGCTILFLPFSEFHNFSLAPHGAIPEKVVSTTATVNQEQGSYYFEYEYSLDKNKNFYQKVPVCYKVTVGQPDREKVSCETTVD